jgi:hypothetical protein
VSNLYDKFGPNDSKIPNALDNYNKDSWEDEDEEDV